MDRAISKLCGVAAGCRRWGVWGWRRIIWLQSRIAGAAAAASAGGRSRSSRHLPWRHQLYRVRDGRDRVTPRLVRSADS